MNRVIGLFASVAALHARTQAAYRWRLGLVAAVSLIPFRPATGQQPDLWIRGGGRTGVVPTIFPETVPNEATITLSSYRIHNAGPIASPAFALGVYLSADASITQGDRLLHSAAFGPLPASSNTEWQPSTLLTIPLDVPPGTYRIGLFVDYVNAIDESDEADNVTLAIPVLTVVAAVNADLTPEVSTSQPLFAVGSEDQEVSSATPLRVAPEGKFWLLAWKVRNQGPDPSGPFKVGFYLSDDAVIDANDDRLRSANSPSIPGSQTRVFGSLRFTLPAEVLPGNYYLGIVADYLNQVGERAGAQETNNVLTIPLTVLDVASESTPVWRVQVRLETGSVDNAATDNEVFVSLTPEEHVSFAGNWLEDLVALENAGTWLDYARNDFDRNDNNFYDLRLKHVKTLGDITSIQVGKTGTDGWCIANLELWINGIRLMTKNYPGECDYIDPPNTSHDVRISYSAMRGDAEWSTPIPRFPSEISRQDLESLIQSVVGHSIHGERAYWGHFHGEPVSITRTSGRKAHVDLDLAARIDNWRDPDLDVDFDIELQSSCSEVGVAVTNVEADVDSPWWFEVATLGLGQLSDYLGNRGLKEELKKRLKSLGQSIPLAEGFRPILEFDTDLNVVFAGFEAC